jgi:hypothetical protein
MFIVLATAFLVISFDYYLAPHCLILLFLPASFFISQLFVMIKRKWISELSFLIFVILTLFNGYSSYLGLFELSSELSARKEIANKVKLDSLIYGKKVLYIGDHSEAYLHSRLATPFLSWTISGKFLHHLDDPGNLIMVTRQILDDLPEVIVDQDNIIKKLFDKSPVLAGKYQIQGREDVFYLIKN